MADCGPVRLFSRMDEMLDTGALWDLWTMMGGFSKMRDSLVRVDDSAWEGVYRG